jgi:hypothetical protein
MKMISISLGILIITMSFASIFANVNAIPVMNNTYNLTGPYNITGDYICDYSDASIYGNTSVWTYFSEPNYFVITNYENNSQYIEPIGLDYPDAPIIYNEYIIYFGYGNESESSIHTYNIITKEFMEIAPSHLYSLLFGVAEPNNTLGTSVLYSQMDMFGANIDIKYYSTNTNETYEVNQTKIPLDYWIETYNWGLSWNGEWVGCGLQNLTSSKVWFGNTVTGEEFTILPNTSEHYYSVISITENNIAMLYNYRDNTIIWYNLNTNETIYNEYSLPAEWEGYQLGGMVDDLFWYFAYNPIDLEYIGYTVIVNVTTNENIVLEAEYISTRCMPIINKLDNGTYEIILVLYGGGEGTRWIPDEYYGGVYLYFLEPILTDVDNDNLPDEWEQQIIDFNETDAIEDIYDVLPNEDFDGDGYTNLQEYQNDTDPTDPLDYPSPTNLLYTIFYSCMFMLILLIIMEIVIDNVRRVLKK